MECNTLRARRIWDAAFQMFRARNELEDISPAFALNKTYWDTANSNQYRLLFSVSLWLCGE